MFCLCWKSSYPSEHKRRPKATALPTSFSNSIDPSKILANFVIKIAITTKAPYPIPPDSKKRIKNNGRSPLSIHDDTPVAQGTYLRCFLHHDLPRREWVTAGNRKIQLSGILRGRCRRRRRPISNTPWLPEKLNLAESRIYRIPPRENAQQLLADVLHASASQ